MTFRSDVPEEFVTKIKGQDYVTHKGLWRVAHERYPGLISSVSELWQAPSAANDQTTIIRCKVTVEHEDGRLQVITGVGDANPENVGRMIAPHAPRMAETRAEGRALRKLLNISMTMVEEMGETGGQTHSRPEQRSNETFQKTAQKATRKQVAKITALATELAGGDQSTGVSKVENHTKSAIGDLDQVAASKLISKLERQVEIRR